MCEHSHSLDRTIKQWLELTKPYQVDCCWRQPFTRYVSVSAASSLHTPIMDLPFCSKSIVDHFVTLLLSTCSRFLPSRSLPPYIHCPIYFLLLIHVNQYVYFSQSLCARATAVSSSRSSSFCFARLVMFKSRNNRAQCKLINTKLGALKSAVIYVLEIVRPMLFLALCQSGRCFQSRCK